MKLTPEAIKEYQEEYFAEFGEKISQNEAKDQANRALILLQHIFNSNENEPPKTTKK